MEITLETLEQFLMQRSSIGIVDSTGTVRMLLPTLPEYFDSARNSDRFWHSKAWRSREEIFEIITDAEGTSVTSSTLQV